MSLLPAVITLAFDPALHLGPLAIRWETILITAGLLLALAMAALLVPRTQDLVLLLIGIVPGAVVGGRIVHVADYLGAYAANPVSAIDPRVGSLSLLGAVIGGALSALYVANLLKLPIRLWADRAAIPLLVALGIGKVAQLFGGSGQGAPFDGPWAVSFGGDGPWVSLAPSLAAHPSQVYEGLWLLAGIPIVLRLVAWTDRAAPAGRLFIGALAWFLAGRVIVGFTWRDPAVLGPLNMEQLLALVVLVAGGAFIWLRSGRRTVTVVGTALCLLTTLACGGSSATPQPTSPLGHPSPSGAPRFTGRHADRRPDHRPGPDAHADLHAGGHDRQPGRRDDHRREDRPAVHGLVLRRHGR